MENDNTLVIRTVADELLEIVNKNKKITLNEAARLLNFSPELLEEIVEFFVESKILEWDYSFTTPNIVLHGELKKNLPVLAKKEAKDESQFIAEEFLEEIKKNKKKRAEAGCWN